MKEFRVDIHIEGIAFMRFFDTEDAARRSAREAHRDGALAVYIMKHTGEDRYEQIAKV